MEVSTTFNKHKRQCMWLLCRSITLCQNLTFMTTTMLVFIMYVPLATTCLCNQIHCLCHVVKNMIIAP
jgi:hypothetical protein